MTADQADLPTVYAAWAAVMGSVRSLGKGDRNPEFNFMFRGIDATMNAVGPALREHGVIVLPELRDVEYVPTQTSRGKPTLDCRVTVAYRIIGPAGDELVTLVPGQAQDSGDKGVSKAMSVAFRTMLLQSLTLPTNEPDPDTYTYERAEDPPVDQGHDAAVRQFIAAWERDTGNDFDAPTAGRRFGQDVRTASTEQLQQWTRQLTETRPAAHPEPPADQTPAGPDESAPRAQTEGGETPGPAGPPPATDTRDGAQRVRESQPASRQQQKMLHALITQIGVTEDKRHEWMSEVLDRYVESATTLTRAEAAQLIDHATKYGRDTTTRD